jgi:hypothetical protein
LKAIGHIDRRPRRIGKDNIKLDFGNNIVRLSIGLTEVSTVSGGGFCEDGKELSGSIKAKTACHISVTGFPQQRPMFDPRSDHVGFELHKAVLECFFFNDSVSPASS